MAKINHHNFVNTINDIATEARTKGVSHLTFESNLWSGDRMIVNDKIMKNFGTCGYLGLETHHEIIEKAVELTQDLGAQFSVSRAYLTSKKNIYLETLLSRMYQGKKTIAFSSTTLTHLAILPIVVGQEDAIIMDQQAHVSIQTAAQLVAVKGVPIEVIRHSNLEMLEHKIKALRNKYDKIWYMIDGVYSMFGDVAPIEAINLLMEKYKQLHLYVDDAHGMSWYGKHGCGRVFELANENQRTIYTSTLAKGFGTMGGLVVFPNECWYEKVILHGGPLAYSHPIPPPMLGAAIGSAEIHLSDQIYVYQQELQEKLNYANELFEATSLPILSDPDTPIFFVGTGQPSFGFKLNQRILNDGYYVNIGLFPAVPVKNTGLRFTITNHNELEDIKGLIESIDMHYHDVLIEEGKTVNDIRKAFRLAPLDEIPESKKINQNKTDLHIELFSTIEEVSKNEWNKRFRGKGNFDWDSLSLMQKAFSGNELPEENWEFKYIIVKNEDNEVIAATFLTIGIFKDDLLSPADISANVEKRRVDDPYFLCSKMVVMGSMLTEGDHLYIDKSNASWKEAVTLLIEMIYKIQEKSEANGIILRDFNEDEDPLFSLIKDKGFFIIDLPNTNIVTNLQENRDTEYLNLLSKHARKNIRQEVFANEEFVTIRVTDSLTAHELDRFYELFLDVSNQNKSINIFAYPRSFFELINEDKDWDFLVVEDKSDKKLLAIVCCYKSEESYFPIIIGLDYQHNKEYKTYKQVVYNLAMHARNSGFKNLHLGLSADFEKRKVGAQQLRKKGFMYIQDQFNIEYLNTINHDHHHV